MDAPLCAHEFEFGPMGGGSPKPDPAPRVEAGSSKIHSFTGGTAFGRHEDNWSRTPNTTKTGAIHVKSFHCKCAEDSLHYLDTQINEWLDKHPQYEVKFSTCSIGEWTGKTKEPHLIVQVWV